jgi:hypothetical protein
VRSAWVIASAGDTIGQSENAGTLSSNLEISRAKSSWSNPASENWGSIRLVKKARSEKSAMRGARIHGALGGARELPRDDGDARRLRCLVGQARLHGSKWPIRRPKRVGAHVRPVDPGGLGGFFPMQPRVRRDISLALFQNNRTEIQPC